MNRNEFDKEMTDIKHNDELILNIKCSDFVLKCYNDKIVPDNSLDFRFLAELRKFTKECMNLVYIPKNNGF